MNYFIELRQTLKDVSASLITSEYISEMQVKKVSYFDERVLYYVCERYCKNYGLTDTAGNERNLYKSLKPVYSLNILSYPHFKEDDDALRIFKLYDPDRNKPFNENFLNIAFFEIVKKHIEIVYTHTGR